MTMVRLTRSVVLQGISKVSIDKRDNLEVDKEFGRITHLHLQRKNITALDSLHLFQSLTVLYLYDNEIEQIQGLEQAINLEILHLQRNKLKRIENLLSCTNLRKLYLGYNEIDTVEGLHALGNLEELHVEYQRLPYGMSLTFDPKSLATLSATLVILNVTGNRITQLEDFAGFEVLHTLTATDNYISDLDSTSLVVRTLVNLEVLDLRNNPISKKPQFTERIVGYGVNIVILNDKEVSETTRAFIKRFAAVKASRLQLAVNSYRKSRSHLPPTACESNSTTGGVGFGLGESPSGSFNLAPIKSNLKLDLENSTASFFPVRKGSSSSPIMPSMDSFSQMEAYLNAAPKDNPYANKCKASVPQFILAPPNFQSSTLLADSKKRKKKGSIRKTSASVPSFKSRTLLGQQPQEITAETLFKTPKTMGDIWACGTKSMELLKAPKSEDLKSKESLLMDGMPMPPPSLLHLDPSATTTTPTNVLGNVIRKPERSRASPRMLHEELLQKEPAPFTTSVYELPPWPHIVRRLASEQPAVSFMP